MIGAELREWLLYTLGEIDDLIAVYQISNGLAELRADEKYIPDLR